METLEIPEALLQSTFTAPDAMAAYVFRVFVTKPSMLEYMNENAQHPYKFEEWYEETYHRAHSGVKITGDRDDLILFRLHFGF